MILYWSDERYKDQKISLLAFTTFICNVPADPWTQKCPLDYLASQLLGNCNHHHTVCLDYYPRNITSMQIDMKICIFHTESLMEKKIMLEVEYEKPSVASGENKIFLYDTADRVYNTRRVRKQIGRPANIGSISNLSLSYQSNHG